LAPLYNFIFDSHTPCMVDKDLSIVQKIRDWYLMEHGTYIRIYGAIKYLHLSPRFVPNRMVLQEIAFQTMIHGIGETLYHDKKAIWPPLPLWVRSYSFESIKKSQSEVDTLISFHFGEERFLRHDPKEVVKEYCSKHKHTWEYTSST